MAGDVLPLQQKARRVSQKTEMMRSQYPFKNRRVAKRIIKWVWLEDSSIQYSTVMTDGL